MVKIAIDCALPDRGTGGVLTVCKSIMNSLVANPNIDIEIYWILLRGTTWWHDIIGKNPNIIFVGSKTVNAFYKILLKYPKISKILTFLYLFYLNAGYRMEKILDANEISLVHVPYQNGLKTLRPFIYHIHDLQHESLQKNFSRLDLYLRNKIWKKKAELAKVLIVENFQIKNELISFWNINPKKIVTLITPPSLKLDQEAINKLEKIRETRSTSSVSLFYPAEFWTHKNHINLLRAFSQVCKVNGDLILEFTGSQDKNYKKIFFETMKLNLKDNVIFLGSLSDHQVIKKYQECNFVIIPSLFESYSLPIFEAIYLKKRILCSALPQFVEQTNGNAMFFDPENISSISAAIQRAYENHLAVYQPINFNFSKLSSDFGSTIETLYLSCIKEKDSELEGYDHLSKHISQYFE